MSDALNRLAADFATANRQEQAALRAEIKGLRRTLWAAIRAAGGEIRLDERDVLFYRDQDCGIESSVDLRNRQIVLRSLPG